MQLSIYFEFETFVNKNGKINTSLILVNELYFRGSVNGNVDSLIPLSIYRNSIGKAPSFSLEGSTQFRMLLSTLFDVQHLITDYFHIDIRKSPSSFI